MTWNPTFPELLSPSKPNDSIAADFRANHPVTMLPLSCPLFRFQIRLAITHLINWENKINQRPLRSDHVLKIPYLVIFSPINIFQNWIIFRASLNSAHIMCPISRCSNERYQQSEIEGGTFALKYSKSSETNLRIVSMVQNCIYDFEWYWLTFRTVWSVLIV